MLKRFIAVILTAVLLTVLCSCGMSKVDDKNGSNGATSVESVSDDTGYESEKDYSTSLVPLDDSKLNTIIMNNCNSDIFNSLTSVADEIGANVEVVEEPDEYGGIISLKCNGYDIGISALHYPNTYGIEVNISVNISNGDNKGKDESGFNKVKDVVKELTGVDLSKNKDAMEVWNSRANVSDDMQSYMRGDDKILSDGTSVSAVIMVMNAGTEDNEMYLMSMSYRYIFDK